MITFAYEDIARALTVRHIQTPKESLVGFAVSDEASHAGHALLMGGFDYGPVLEDGEIIGRVAIAGLEGRADNVGSHVEPLAARYLVSADASIAEVMSWLQRDPWLVVIDGQGISGVVTPSDLNRQAARTYFYLLVADFEMRLADTIRRRFEDQADALALLSEDQRTEIEGRFAAAVEHGVEADYVSSMDLSDLIKIAKNDAVTRQAFGFESSTAWKNATGAIPDLRHEVMHPVRGILSDRKGLARLVNLEKRLRNLVSDGAVAPEH